MQSSTSPISMTIVCDEVSHPIRGAAIKYDNLLWMIPVAV